MVGEKMWVLLVAFTPIWPKLLLPQHHTDPSVRRAHVWAAPATIWVILERIGVDD